MAAEFCTAQEIEAVLRERGWLRSGDGSAEDSALQEWLCRAADLLAPYATDRESLAALLEMLFVYDARELLRSSEAQEVLSRTGAREVIREVAHRVLEGGDIDSDRFKEIIEGVKLAVPYRSRAMFHPIRLALTGHAGEGDLDRVILLIDPASRVPSVSHVSTTRERMMEFCAALD
ncbi:MAG TPA: hypothetical protein VMH00_06365 [Candidatus Limnocylindrales bacterium]|nr:hypothetical protein [Candidatus Limnocylindrales bacterium]